MGKCNYNSKKHGLLMPTNTSINGIQLSNLDPYLNDYVNVYIMKKLIKDKKKRKYYEE